MHKRNKQVKWWITGALKASICHMLSVNNSVYTMKWFYTLYSACWHEASLEHSISIWLVESEAQLRSSRWRYLAVSTSSHTHTYGLALGARQIEVQLATIRIAKFHRRASYVLWDNTCSVIKEWHNDCAMQASNYVSAQQLNLYRIYLVCHMTVDSHREASLSCARNPPGLHLPPIRARSGSTEEICNKKKANQNNEEK